MSTTNVNTMKAVKAVGLCEDSEERAMNINHKRTTKTIHFEVSIKVDNDVWPQMEGDHHEGNDNSTGQRNEIILNNSTQLI